MNSLRPSIFFRSERLESKCAYFFPEPSVFGRELTEQVRADARSTDRMVPLIVEKCIAAVEATGELLFDMYRI
jgi:hypothetical protein